MLSNSIPRALRTKQRLDFQLIVVVLATCALSGCKAREMAVAFSPTQSKHVDSSWLAAAQSCWPMLIHAGYTNEAIKAELADPLHFRNTFSTYASLSDDQILAAVAAPLSAAPDPDSTVLKGAATGFLSRTQAAAGAAPDPHAASGGEPPADTLCAIHPGTPIGFK